MSGGRVQAAFYCKRGDWVDGVIRWRTSSPFSHVELVVDGVCLSSSGRDGGVREKAIALESGDWVLVALPWADVAQVMGFFANTRGCGYDWLGVLVGQAASFSVQDKGRWFCSEWCAAALGLGEPWRYSPGLLFHVLQDAANGRYAGKIAH